MNAWKLYRNSAEDTFTGRNGDLKSNVKKNKKSSSVIKFSQIKNSGNYSQRKLSVGPIATTKLSHLPKEMTDSKTFKHGGKADNVNLRLQNAIMPQMNFNLKSNLKTSK